MRIRRLQLLALKIVNRKMENNITQEAAKIKHHLSNLLGEEKISELEKSFQYKEKLYLTHVGLKKIQHQIQTTYINTLLTEHKTNKPLMQLKRIREELKTPEKNMRELMGGFSSTRQQNVEQRFFRPRNQTLNGQQIDKSFTAKKWLSSNKILVTASAAQTGLSTAAGTIAFPSVILALGGAHLATIKILGIAAIAGALTTPVGLGIALGAAALITIGLVGFSIYCQYREAQREHLFLGLSNQLEQQKSMKELNTEKYANILRINSICKKIKSQLRRPKEELIERTSLLRREPSSYLVDTNKVNNVNRSPNHSSTASFLSRSSSTLQTFVTPPSSPLKSRNKSHHAQEAQMQLNANNITSIT